MYPILLHIYGPFNIYSFSCAIAIGLFTGLFLARKRAQAKHINILDFTNGFIECALIGIVGGRLLHIFSEWHNYQTFTQMLYIWNGGLSVLGAFLAVLFYAPWYAKAKKLPLLESFDCVALYAPLTQSIARIGCLLAGCCYGQPTTSAWAITYTNSDVVAPLHIGLHPTQLYSSLCLFFIFLFLYKTERYYQTGQITMVYLMLSSIERWSLDFIRGDRVIESTNSFIYTSLLSLDQWVALAVFSIGLIGFCILKARSKYTLGVHEHI